MGVSASTLKEHDPKVPLLICGHGADECYDDGSLQVFDVPKGCVYVTFTTCSITNTASIIYRKIFSDINNIKYLNDPIKYQNELEELFGQNIHIHHPDAEDPVSRTYVNSAYGLVGNGADNKEKCWIQLSGINPLNENTYKILKPLLLKKPNLTFDHDCDDDVSRIQGFVQLTNFYKASVYPTVNQLTNHIRNLRETKRIVTTQDVFDTLPVVTQKELFDIMPGIYYNPLCRVVACDSNNITTRINQSSRALFKKKNIIDNKDQFIKLLFNAIHASVDYDRYALYNYLRNEYARKNKYHYNYEYKNHIMKQIEPLLSRFDEKRRNDYEGLINYFFHDSSKNTNTNSNTNSTITNNTYSIANNTNTNNNNNFKTIKLNRPKKYNFNMTPTRVNRGGRRRETRRRKTKRRKTRRINT
jgi:hypothetical protein